MKAWTVQSTTGRGGFGGPYLRAEDAYEVLGEEYGRDQVVVQVEVGVGEKVFDLKSRTWLTVTEVVEAAL